MKFAPAQQDKLLQLAELDQGLQSLDAQISTLATQSDLVSLHRELAECNGKLADARSALELSAVELRRLENDVELVEKRLALDEQRLNSTSSSKDAEGISHEIGSLKLRLSNLEDQELQLLEERDSLQSIVDVLLQEQLVLQEKLALAEQNEQREAHRLALSKREISEARNSKAREIEPELLAIYEKKLQRGVAAARLIGRDCGACRLALTASTYDEILALPVEELATCPNCLAVLVR